MKTGLNFLWFVLGGIFSGLFWYFTGAIMAITVIGLPWARACFLLGTFNFFPFGYEVISRKDLTGEKDIGTGALGMIGNVIWFALCGWWLALSHLIWAVTLGLTIIGIPFAIQHIKLAGAALFPVGKAVESNETVALAKQQNAVARIQNLRGTQSLSVTPHSSSSAASGRT